jgi:hypothetical protein
VEHNFNILHSFLQALGLGEIAKGVLDRQILEQNQGTGGAVKGAYSVTFRH